MPAPVTSEMHGARGRPYDPAAKPSGEIRKLTSLLEASQGLANATNSKASLHRVLEILERSHAAVCGAVALEAGEQLPLHIAASLGVRDKQWAATVPTGVLARQVFATVVHFFFLAHGARRLLYISSSANGTQWNSTSRIPGSSRRYSGIRIVQGRVYTVGSSIVASYMR